ncbi:TPA: DUF1643 domain-containing protein [Neisseria weaveri]
MEYNIDIYETDKRNRHRFALGSLSKRTLFVIGLNPSTADDKEPDPTIKQVMFFTEKHEYESFLMFNLYPLRTPHPQNLPQVPDMKVVKENVEKIFNIISQEKNADIWVAWGGDILSRDYLWSCLEGIYLKLEKCSIRNWYRLGELLASGHPKHPSRKSHDLNFEKMDMKVYLENFKR